MTAKQLPGLFAPDGSQYITLTDGNGNLTSTGMTIGSTTISGGGSGYVLYENSSSKLANDSGFTYAGAGGQITITGAQYNPIKINIDPDSVAQNSSYININSTSPSGNTRSGWTWSNVNGFLYTMGVDLGASGDHNFFWFDEVLGQQVMSLDNSGNVHFNTVVCSNANINGAVIDFNQTNSNQWTMPGGIRTDSQFDNSQPALAIHTFGYRAWIYQYIDGLSTMDLAIANSAGEFSFTSNPGDHVWKFSGSIDLIFTSATGPTGGGTIFEVCRFKGGGGIILGGGSISWSNTTGNANSADTFISRGGAANIHLGGADTVIPTAQTLSVQSVTTSWSNGSGANWSLQGSLSTGSGTSGDILFKTGVKPGAGSPTTQATPTTALTIKGETQLVYTNSATQILGTKTTITGGSTGNVPTLTSGPVTGNPTKWLPYDDNGTTRYIPSW